jgi:desmoglein 1
LFQYAISIEENALHSELLQIRVIDLDEEFSANWMAVIFFISGNEGGWFDIEMNERTNVGILKVVKVQYNYSSLFSSSFLKMLSLK